MQDNIRYTGLDGNPIYRLTPFDPELPRKAPIENDTACYLVQKERTGGANDKGRWHSYTKTVYYQLPSEAARDKCLMESPKRNAYTGHTISYQKIERVSIPADARIIDLSNIYQ